MIKKLYYWLVGHIIAPFMYDKKYMKSKYFKGKLGGFNAPGWRWIVADFRARRMFNTNCGVRFPVSFANIVNGYQNVHFDIDNLNIFRGVGKYFQAFNAEIYIGKGTHIANNVCIVTTNHDLSDPSKHAPGKEVRIGANCWIGFGAKIMPGVVLGDHTVVGAGAVVTKSFADGYCVIGGNPAKFIKTIECANNIE